MVTRSAVVPKTVAVAAGQILARAALEAFSSASSMSPANKLAYTRFNLEEDCIQQNDGYRIELICQTLEQLLTEIHPEVSWDEVQSAVAEQIQAARERFHSPQGITPSTLAAVAASTR
jgi:hypothetical protein